ncbi:adenosine deaminase-like protein isoform X2 [Stegodyphus dumicola]|uniref:adenosine deaminase-like protein isoform X2 n=1 Tax=Stegodyphus dumicola TaxID=202533 RepID=UPI0015AB01EC|nr:adenosine deaminase-like protein isoform X2 [Stegodyphus dumicola]
MDSGGSGEPLVDYFKSMPKELHAHLNGSLSENTVRKLIELKKEKENISQSYLNFSYSTSRNLFECFQLFNLIHGITDSPEAIYKATLDIIEDFYNDGVHYLELRTTPKEVKERMTQDIYVETVLKAINDACTSSCKEMTVKLLLSIDRGRPFSFAEEMLKIAQKHTILSPVVTGIDLSGNPMAGDVYKFIPLLEYAKKIGLRLAVHISEVPNEYNEVKQLLRLKPDRLGHGTYLHPLKGGSQENYDLLHQLRIPLEICLTSNVISKTVPSYEEHHFRHFKSENYPCVLCTDDKGIFSTSLSNEYSLAYKYYGLTKDELFDLSFESINYTFSDDAEKQKLREIWKKRKNINEVK